MKMHERAANLALAGMFLVQFVAAFTLFTTFPPSSFSFDKSILADLRGLLFYNICSFELGTACG